VWVAARAGFSPAHVAQLEAGYLPRRGNAVKRIEGVLAECERHALDQAAADRSGLKTGDRNAR